MPIKDPIKRKEYKHEWYLKNKERLAAKQLERYNKNKKHILENMKKYSEEHKEDIARWQKKYREENKEKYSEKSKINRNKPATYEIFAEKLYPYEETRRDELNSELLQVRCKNSNCRKWFNPTKQQVQNRVSSVIGRNFGNNYFYCCDDCKRSCSLFGQSKYPKDFKKNFYREVQPELRNMVLERDNWTCQKCNRSKDEYPELDLHCHHIFPINENPIESADIDTCVTLCKDCHKDIHKNIPGCDYHEMKCSK